MSQKDLDVVRGIMQAAADSYDGALDEKASQSRLVSKEKKAIRF